MARPVRILSASRPIRQLCAALLLGLSLPAMAQNTLSLLSWSDYIDPDLIRAFEQEFDVRIEHVNFDNEDERDRKMTAADGRGFDLILVNNNSLPDYIAMNWLSPVNEQQLSQFEHIDSRWRYVQNDEHYAMPYLWGTIGIAWRADQVRQAPKNWNELYTLAANGKQPVELMENHRDLMGTALLASGHSVNSQSDKALRQASALIRDALKGEARLNNPILTSDAPLVRGDVHLAMMYNGDALFLAELDPEIRFTVPESGTIMWVDYWAIARHSENGELAHRFLDFINRPEIAARNSEYLHYASTNYSALKLLSDDVYSDELIYPPKATVERAEVNQALPPKVRARYQYWYHRAKTHQPKRPASR